MVEIQIPVRFLGYDAVMYLIAAIIGFAVSYYAFRLYNMTSKRNHLYFYLAFVILSMGIAVLGITSAFNWINFLLYNRIEILDKTAYLDDFGFWVYYIASLVAYGLLAVSYLPQRSRLLPIALPYWYTGFPYFQLSALFLLFYVIFRNIVNFLSKKNIDSFLVMFAFVSLGMFHGLLLLSYLGKIVYVVAHIWLILAFGSLLATLIRVNR